MLRYHLPLIQLSQIKYVKLSTCVFFIFIYFVTCFVYMLLIMLLNITNNSYFYIIDKVVLILPELKFFASVRLY
jgi:hypothetical protein